MKRKLVAVLLLAAMSVTSLAGCGSDGGSGNDAESSRGVAKRMMPGMRTMPGTRQTENPPRRPQRWTRTAR